MQLLRAAVSTSSASATCRLGSRLSSPAASAAATSLGTHGRSSRLLALVPRSSNSSSASSSSSSRRLLSVGAALVAATAGGVPWRQAAGAVAGNRAMATPAAAAAPGGSTSPDTGVLVVYVTAPSDEVGESLAQALVESSLAACVNILPGVTSVYRWQGKLEKDAEVLLVIKTTAELLPTLTGKVKELHPYDEPEVIALPVVGGSEGYLSWVKDSTAAAVKRVM